MEKKIVKKTYSETVYVADDGTQFEEPEECERYEKESGLKKIISGIERADLDCALPCKEMVDYDRYVYAWYKPKSAEEIEALEEYYQPTCGISEDCVGKWIEIEFEGEEDETPTGDAYCDEIDGSFSDVIHFYGALGYKVTFEDAKTGELICTTESQEMDYIINYAKEGRGLKGLRILWWSYCIRHGERKGDVSYEEYLLNVFDAYQESFSEEKKYDFDEFSSYMGEIYD